MPEFVDGAGLVKLLLGEASRNTKVDLAVAFWGAGAVENLGLSDDNRIRIVCNLAHGATNPAEIRKLQALGAEVRQLEDLHAKIGVVGELSFLGSSNMSANGLGSEGARASWREANIVYSKPREEIVKLFDEYWRAAKEITETDLDRAETLWRQRQKAGATINARKSGVNLVEMIRKAPAELDALNVRMVVYEPITNKNDKEKLDQVEKQVQDEYQGSINNKLDVYWDWESLTTEAADAYLVEYEWPAKSRPIQNGELRRRNVQVLPDFERDGETFHPGYEIQDIEGIKFEQTDKDAICKAFHAYVRAGAKAEEGAGTYNFLISELRPHFLSKAK